MSDGMGHAAFIEIMKRGADFAQISVSSESKEDVQALAEHVFKAAQKACPGVYFEFHMTAPNGIQIVRRAAVDGPIGTISGFEA